MNKLIKDFEVHQSLSNNLLSIAVDKFILSKIVSVLKYFRQELDPKFAGFFRVAE